MIYDTIVEYRFKKNKGISIGKANIVTTETSAMDIQKYDSKCLHYVKAQVFGVKSKAYSENNFWFTKIISQNPISRSFALLEEYDEINDKWIAVR